MIALAAGVSFPATGGVGFQTKSTALDDGLAIECGSLHLVTTTSLLRKLLSVLTLKNNKGYLGASAALFVDCTNVLYHARSRGLEFLNDRGQNKARTSIAQTPVGALVPFCYVIREAETMEAHFVWTRIDNPQIDDRLRGLLDLHFPTGIGSEQGFTVPSDV